MLKLPIARVKYFRNTVYGHAEQAFVDDATFDTLEGNPRQVRHCSKTRRSDLQGTK